ncbi:unnamed protein product [Trichogramma brassicae]|uniref:Uncharacterized protein n=1 Tax=Trichogramma brassicae TaxID=86971 RepID=A0A6H5I0M6_9HYME|nr:unnamed protein product [Trichogramma brassicae]
MHSGFIIDRTTCASCPSTISPRTGRLLPTASVPSTIPQYRPDDFASVLSTISQWTGRLLTLVSLRPYRSMDQRTIVSPGRVYPFNHPHGLPG